MKPLSSPGMSSTALVPLERIEKSILLIRGHKVMLDADLAKLYGVPVRRLNEQVKRNADRFPVDFLFRLTAEEVDALRSQTATLKRGRGQHRKYLPYAFTEHGALMAANVLRSRRAVEVSVLVVRAFVRLRELAGSHADLAGRLDELERKTDVRFRAVFVTIRKLMAPAPVPPRQRIGFRPETK